VNCSKDLLRGFPFVLYSNVKHAITHVHNRPTRTVDIRRDDAVGVLQHDLCALNRQHPAVPTRLSGAISDVPLLLLQLSLGFPRIGAGDDVFLPVGADGECTDVVYCV